MEQLWAPWRMEYIRQNKAKDCFLCAAFREQRDREQHVLKRGSACAVIMNRYPYNNGHLMVAPYRHLATLADMTQDERLEAINLVEEARAALETLMHPDGFNIGINLGEAAGAGLKDHIHMHIVPRWSGDTNFMPVLADVRVIPQSLDELYVMLQAEMA